MTNEERLTEDGEPSVETGEDCAVCRQLQLESYEVVDPASRPVTDRCFFGATVTVEDEDGDQATYQIVGGDELDDDLGPGRISYEAPLGKALLGKREGDTVRVRRPAGDTDLTLVKLAYR